MQEGPETTEAMDAMEKFLVGSTIELDTLRQQTEASELTCQVLQASRYTPSSSDNDQFWELCAWPNRIQEVRCLPSSPATLLFARGMLISEGLATDCGPICGLATTGRARQCTAEMLQRGRACKLCGAMVQLAFGRVPRSSITAASISSCGLDANCCPRAGPVL